MPDVNLTTARLTVRPAAADDVPAIVAYFVDNQAFLEQWEPARPDGFYTEQFWSEQMARNREHAESDRALRMFIFPNHAPREVIGTVNLTEFVRGAFHACYLGYGLSAAHEGKGYMREALRAAIPHAFGPLRMHRIMANYVPHNRRSAGVLKALGFQVEGYARDYLRINGRWEDHVLTSLTNPDWTE